MTTILESSIAQPETNIQYAQFIQPNQPAVFPWQPIYHSAANQQMIIQQMTMQGQPGALTMMTRPQMTTGYMQQPVAQFNSPYAFHNKAQTSQLVAQAGLPYALSHTNTNVHPIAQPAVQNTHPDAHINPPGESKSSISNAQPVAQTDPISASNVELPRDDPPSYSSQWTKFDN